MHSDVICTKFSSHPETIPFAVCDLTIHLYFDFWLGVIANVGRTNLQIVNNVLVEFPKSQSEEHHTYPSYKDSSGCQVTPSPSPDQHNVSSPDPDPPPQSTKE